MSDMTNTFSDGKASNSRIPYGIPEEPVMATTYLIGLRRQAPDI